MPPCGCPCTGARPNEIDYVVAETTKTFIRMCPARLKQICFWGVMGGCFINFDWIVCLCKGPAEPKQKENIKEHTQIQHSVCRQDHLPPCLCPCARARPNKIERVVAETTNKVIRMCPAQQKRNLCFFVGEGCFINYDWIACLCKGPDEQKQKKSTKERMHRQHSVCRHDNLLPCGCPCTRTRPNEIECDVVEATSESNSHMSGAIIAKIYFGVGVGGVLLIMIGSYACTRGQLSQNRRKTQRRTYTDNAMFAVMRICFSRNH